MYNVALCVVLCVKNCLLVKVCGNLFFVTNHCMKDFTVYDNSELALPLSVGWRKTNCI